MFFLAIKSPRSSYTLEGMEKRQPSSQEFHEHTRPFLAGSASTAVLLCHGFTGSPWSMRPWAEALADAGYRVSVPLLPGHGTTWQDMNQTSWTQWYDCVDAEYQKLTDECEQVFVAGLSMGGGLAVRLAEHHDDVAGLLLVNPAVALKDPRLFALPLMQRFIPSLASIGNDIAKPGVIEYSYSRNPLTALHQAMQLFTDVRAGLDLVTAPLLLFRSRQDHTVPAYSSELILRQVSSTEIRELVLERSYHVATLDYDAERIFTESIEFIKAHPAAR